MSGSPPPPPAIHPARKGSPMPQGPADTALAALQRGDLASCHRMTSELLRANPYDAGAIMLRGLSTPPADAVLALPLLQLACRIAPHNAEHWFQLGRWHEQRGRFVDAARAFRRAMALDPAHLPALSRGTEMLRVTEQFAEAIGFARRMQRVLPNDPAGFAHEAISLQHLGELEASDAMFDAAIQRSRDPALLHWEHQFSLLRRQRFAEAWDKYEVRFDCAEANSVDDMAFTLPRWRGEPGQHVLAYGEQGIGDQLMFASALSDLIARASRVSLAVAPAMVDLFRASFPTIHVFPIERKRDPKACARVAEAAGAVVPVDATLPLGSLMAMFRRDRAAFTGMPYLRASDAAREYWASRGAAPSVSPQGGGKPFRIGVCWSCNPSLQQFSLARRAQHRTMPFGDMARLAQVPGVSATAITNVSLRDFGIDDAAAGGIADVSSALTSIDRTAALLEEIDLLVTVDTGVAHLAGGLGVPVWILLHAAGDPRWGAPGSEASYWYRSATLFWQAEPGNWSEVIDRVEAALRETIAAPRRRSVA